MFHQLQDTRVHSLAFLRSRCSSQVPTARGQGAAAAAVCACDNPVGTSVRSVTAVLAAHRPGVPATWDLYGDQHRS